MSALLSGPDPGTLTLALSAGLVAAVNPCGFALLPAYLSLFVLDDTSPSMLATLGRAMRATLALTLGFTLVFTVFGLAIAPLASSIQNYLPGFTIVLGVVLAAAGVWVAAGRQLPKLARPGRSRARGPITASWLSMTGFGASYAIASLSCTVAPFLAVVVASFRYTSPLAGSILFVAYGAGMGLAVGLAAAAVALARRGMVTRMQHIGRVVPRLGGVVLAVAGIYVAWYGIWEFRVLHSGAGSDPVIGALSPVQQWLATRTQAMGAFGFGVGLLVLFGIAIVARARRRPPAPTDRVSSPADRPRPSRQQP